MDHHCPWSSKCIGDGNMNCFKAFLAGTVASLVYVVVAMMFVFRVVVEVEVDVEFVWLVSLV